MDFPKMRKFMKEEVGLWSPDVFRLDEISASNSLVCVAYNAFKTRKLSCIFKVSPPTFINFILAIQNRYHSSNPYHNHIHAADVLLTTDFLLKAKPLENVFSKLEVFAAVVAAAVHDVDHPGRSNQFLIETSDRLALLYNDNSVLESHHLAVTFQTLAEPGCNFLEHMDKEQTKAFRRMVIDMVS
jgi:cAMP-specific phosphodiesterase 4